MQRILTLLVVVALVMTAGVLQAQAAFVAGTPAGTNIAVGGDSGTPSPPRPPPSAATRGRRATAMSAPGSALRSPGITSPVYIQHFTPIHPYVVWLVAVP